MQYRYAILGSDKRMAETAKGLCRDGYTACMLGSKNSFDGFDVIILPVGCDFESIKHKCEGKKVFAPFDREGCINYLKLDSFKNANAVPSAEGAIYTLMGMTESTVEGMNIGITGLGAIGRQLYKKLDALGARVRVFARGDKEGALPLSQLYGAELDVLLNTVPAKIIKEDVLRSFPRKPLIIDLASRPGGVDFEAAEMLGITAVHELGIPAKYAPKTAGEILKNTVISYLRGVK